MLLKKIILFKEKQSTSLEHKNSLVNYLIKENEALNKKNNKVNDIVLKFTNGPRNLEKLLNSQKCVFDEGGLGYKPTSKQKYYKKYFVKVVLTSEHQIICNYSNGNGHMSYVCPIRRNIYLGIRKV